MSRTTYSAELPILPSHLFRIILPNNCMGPVLPSSSTENNKKENAGRHSFANQCALGSVRNCFTGVHSSRPEFVSTLTCDRHRCSLYFLVCPYLDAVIVHRLLPRMNSVRRNLSRLVVVPDSCRLTSNAFGELRLDSCWKSEHLRQASIGLKPNCCRVLSPDPKRSLGVRRVRHKYIVLSSFVYR